MRPISRLFPSSIAVWLATALAALAGTGNAADPVDLLRPQAPAVVRAETVALLLSDQDGGSLRLATLAVAHLHRPAATVLVEIDGSSLLEGHRGTVLRADVFVYVMGPSRETLAHTAQRLALDLDRYGERLRNAGVRFAAVLDLPPGQHRLRILVRGETGAFGLASAEVTVAEPEDTPRHSRPPRLLPPLLATASPAWLTVVSEPDEARLTEHWRWLDAAGPEPAWSTACRGVVRAASSHQLILVATSAEPRSAALGAVLESADGESVPLELESTERLSDSPPGTTAWRTSFRAPDAPAGAYRLIGRVDGALSPPLPVIVTPAATAAEAPTVTAWTEIDLEGLGSGVELPPAGAGLGTSARRRSDDEIIGDYLQAVGQLVVSDPTNALRRLYELEARVVAEIETDGLKELARIENGTLAALVDNHPRALLPILLLHAASVRGYRAGARPGLVGHAEAMVLRLVRTWVEYTGDEATRRQAATVLAGIAAELRRLGTLGRAEELYRHALEIDPHNQDLVLAVAAIQERWGHAAEVVATLEALAPEQLGAEGRLRLAINLRRTGRRARGERLLGALAADSGAPAWVRILAIEEAAKSALERQKTEAALTLVHRGLEVWGDHPTLRLQSAFVLDRLGRHDEAAAIVEALADQNAAAAGGERFRYNEWPRGELAARRAELEERAQAELPALRQALEDFLGGEGPLAGGGE